MNKRIAAISSAQGINNLHYALRIAIACAVAALIYHSLNLTMGYWVLITSIITIQANLGASIIRAKDRLLGTFLGVLIGGFILVFYPNNYFIMFVIVPALIFLTVYLYSISYAYAIFFGSVLLIILLSQQTSNAWQFVYYRIVDTLLGIAIGLSASYLLWKKNAKTELYNHVIALIQAQKHYLLLLLDNYQRDQLDSEALFLQQQNIEAILVVNKQLFAEFTYEPGAMAVSTEAIYSVILNLEVIYDILLTIRLAISINNHKLLTADESQRVDQFTQQIIHAFDEITKAVNIRTYSEQSLNLSNVMTDSNVILLDQGRVRTTLLSYDAEKFNLILFTSNIKRLATELKYIVESIKQL